MKAIILGSGGANPPPRPTCQCKICREARIGKESGYQSGASFFIFDQMALFNAPEEIGAQLNHCNIDMVKHLFLPDWDYQHLMGLRILERLNYDRVLDQPVWDPINVYIPSEPDPSGFFQRILERYQDDLGIINLVKMDDCRKIELEEMTVIPVKLDGQPGYYFIIYDSTGKIVYAPIRYKELSLISEAYDPQYFITPCFFWEDKEVLNRKILNKRLLKDHCTFEKMLQIGEEIRAKIIMVTHIEEDYGMSAHDLKVLSHVKFKYFPLKFAHDGMPLET